MKAIRNYIDKIKPQFEKGGKFEKLHSTFDAFETFLYVPNTVTKHGSHIRDSLDMKRTMIVVVLATIPAMLFGMWNIGYQHFLSHGETVTFWQEFWYGFLKVLPLIIVSYVVGLGIEFAFAQMRNHEVNEGYLVTGILIPLIVPPDIPLWMLAVAVVFAVIIGKEVFGGTGMNILNPALAARAFLFFAYPQDMSGDKVWIAEKADAYSGATPLGHALVGDLEPVRASFNDMLIGTIPGSVGETSFIAIMIGAVILLATGIGSWRILIPVFAGGYVMGLIFNLFAVNEYMALPPYYHFVMGGFAFGAVFMATEPVTATQTNRGKYIYGFLIGMIAVLIRVFNPAYPEGMMLAILLMNVFAPLIDHYVLEGNIKRRLKRVKVKSA
ncbi:MAG: NADH:ubiquinone reductase (Na(+)-transporting) subunit B [Bacteroidales bacterium]|nr:NADH:ubiquinone reductase (Na(+)-transporting) subunit B [Bacteroidales bacterium]